GNTAKFLPGPSMSSPPPLSGPTNLGDTVVKTALDKLLSQMEALQGGYTASFGPFDPRGLVTPSGPGSTPPHLQAFTRPSHPHDPSRLVPTDIERTGDVPVVDPGHAEGDRNDQRRYEAELHPERRLPRRLAVAGPQHQPHRPGDRAEALRNAVRPTNGAAGRGG